MLPARAGTMSNRLRHKGQILLFFRFSSRNSEAEADPLQDDLLRRQPQSPESLFGIAPRKIGTLEEEDSVSESPYLIKREAMEPALEPGNAEQVNYFSKAWAAQKSRPWSQGIQEEAWPQVIQQERLPPKVYSQDQLSPPAKDLHRTWVQSAEAAAPSQERFTVASYNILGSKYATKYRSQLYRHVPFAHLDWKERKKRILLELELCSSDIICLQVIDMFKDMQLELALKGYVGLFKVRTGIAPDGCAVFWKEDRFKLLNESSIEFKEHGMNDNVAQLCVFESIVPGAPIHGINSQSSSGEQDLNKILVVGNINVLFNPRRGDVKLGQCRLFLDHVHELSSLWNGAPAVVAGCFNFTPSSPIYEFLEEAELDVSSLDRCSISGQEPPSMPRPNTILQEIRSESRLKDMLKTTLPARFASSQGHCTELADAGKVGSKQSEVSNAIKGVIKESEGKEGVEGAPSSIDRNQGPTSSNNGKDGVPSPKNGSERLGSHSALLSQALNMLKSLSGSLSATSNNVGTDENRNKVCGESKDAVESEEGKKEVNHCWNPEELKTATGSPDCCVLRHKLKLHSVYPEIQGRKDTRDSKGEPLVTAYHKEFRGTVDYIWRSDGLQSLKVLDTVPLNTLLLTGGLPSKVWGSDHLALAAELCFSSNQKLQ